MIRKLMLFVLALGVATSVCAEVVAIDSPRLTLDGNNVDLNFNITGMTRAVRDVKVLFCDCNAKAAPFKGFTEDSQLQPFPEWYASSTEGRTTLKQMLIDGWTLHSFATLSTGANGQFYLIFVR